MLNIIKNLDNGVLTIALDGRMDIATAPKLEEEIKNSLNGVTELVIDCTKLSYISSAGLRVLLFAQKKMNNRGSMKVIHINEAVMEIFETMGFMDIMNLE